MTEHDLPDLPPDVTALLDAARGVPAAPEGDRRKVAARLALATGLAIPGASLAGANVAAGTWLAKAVAVALVVAGAGIAANAPSKRLAPPPPVTNTHRAPVVTPQRTAHVTIAAPPPLVAPVAVTAPAPRLPVVTHHATSTDDRALEDELALLQRAHGSLSRGAIDDALSALDTHAHRYPHGRLEPEREALRVQCAAARGDHSIAEAARERFHRRFPDSVLGAAVDRSVDGAQQGYREEL